MARASQHASFTLGLRASAGRVQTWRSNRSKGSAIAISCGVSVLDRGTTQIANDGRAILVRSRALMSPVRMPPREQEHWIGAWRGGYKVSYGKTDGETFEYLATAVEQEMEIRTLLHDVHADLPYYSEANLLLNCSTP